MAIHDAFQKLFTLGVGYTRIVVLEPAWGGLAEERGYEHGVHTKR